MTLFSDLSRSPTLPIPRDGALGEWQKGVDALFPAAVATSSLRLWSAGGPIPTTGTRLLIGVATWSPQDMALLDAVAHARQIGSPHFIVEVFNVADCPSAAAFKQYIPGIAGVFHTPVVGFWSDGELVDKASGKAGRELVARVCGLEATALGPSLSQE